MFFPPLVCKITYYQIFKSFEHIVSEFNFYEFSLNLFHICNFNNLLENKYKISIKTTGHDFEIMKGNTFYYFCNT